MDMKQPVQDCAFLLFLKGLNNIRNLQILAGLSQLSQSQPDRRSKWNRIWAEDMAYKVTAK